MEQWDSMVIWGFGQEKKGVPLIKEILAVNIEVYMLFQKNKGKRKGLGVYLHVKQNLIRSIKVMVELTHIAMYYPKARTNPKVPASAHASAYNSHLSIREERSATQMSPGPIVRGPAREFWAGKGTKHLQEKRGTTSVVEGQANQYQTGKAVQNPEWRT